MQLMLLSGAEIDRDSRGGDNAIHTLSIGEGGWVFGEVYLIRRNPAPYETVVERTLVCMQRPRSDTYHRSKGSADLGDEMAAWLSGPGVLRLGH